MLDNPWRKSPLQFLAKALPAVLAIIAVDAGGQAAVASAGKALAPRADIQEQPVAEIILTQGELEMPEPQLPPVITPSHQSSTQPEFQFPKNSQSGVLEPYSDQFQTQTESQDSGSMYIPSHSEMPPIIHQEKDEPNFRSSPEAYWQPVWDSANLGWPRDKWILGRGLEAVGDERQYIVHTRQPRFVARVVQGNEMPVDGASCAFTALLFTYLLCDFHWIDLRPASDELTRLLKDAAPHVQGALLPKEAARQSSVPAPSPATR